MLPENVYIDKTEVKKIITYYIFIIKFSEEFFLSFGSKPCYNNQTKSVGLPVIFPVSPNNNCILKLLITYNPWANLWIFESNFQINTKFCEWERIWKCTMIYKKKSMLEKKHNIELTIYV